MDTNRSGGEYKRLLKRLKAGDEGAFREVYQIYHKELYRVALKYLRSKPRAEDAVHDIFIKLWNKKKSLDKSGSLRGFLFTVVTNHVLNIIDRQKRTLKKEIELAYEKKVDREEPDNVIVLSEYRDVYQTAVNQLPPRRREVFELRMKEGLTNKEVADYLDLSIHTVKSQYYKATQSIKAYVAGKMDGETGS
jgi:RNA polymerase sigma-70 factor (ECF subfamily)